MTESNTQEIDPLKEMYKQVKDLDFDLLISGLTVLLKDTMTYITEQGIDSQTAEGFRQTFLNMLNDSRYYRERITPELYQPLEDCKLTKDMQGIIERITNSQTGLELLCDRKLADEEWLRSPGWHFLQTYSAQKGSDILGGLTVDTFKAAFCAGRDPYKKKEKCEESDPYKPIKAVVEKLAGSEKQWKKYWHPLMLYVVVLIQRTNFTTLEDIA